MTKRIDMVDISEAQGLNFKLNDLRDKNGINILYMRSTHGSDDASINYFWRDKTFYRHWDSAKELGMRRGAYIVSDPDGDPIAQAHGAMETIGILQRNDLPPAIDFEKFPTPPEHIKNNARLYYAWCRDVANRLAPWLITHITEVRRLSGRKPVLYMGGMTLMNFGTDPRLQELKQYVFWLAQYLSTVTQEPPFTQPYSIWQYLGDTAPHLNGYKLPIDLNEFSRSKEDTLALLDAQYEGPQVFEFRNTLGLQRGLCQLGYDTKGIDDKFGPATKAALKEFQQDRGLTITGVLTEGTIYELNKAVQESLEEAPDCSVSCVYELADGETLEVCGGGCAAGQEPCDFTDDPTPTETV